MSVGIGIAFFILFSLHQFQIVLGKLSRFQLPAAAFGSLGYFLGIICRPGNIGQIFYEGNKEAALFLKELFLGLALVILWGELFGEIDQLPGFIGTGIFLPLPEGIVFLVPGGVIFGVVAFALFS